MNIVVRGEGRTRRRPRRGWTRSRSARAKVAQADRVPARRGLHHPRRPRRPPRPDRRPPARTKIALLASSRDRRHELAGRRRSSCTSAAGQGPGQARGLLRRRPPPGPVKPGSGGLIWPVNGPITSPFCESRSWESCHPGIDIGVPAGTPIRAAASGKVVLMQGAGVLRRLRQLHLHPARAARCRRVTRTSRGSARRWARRVSQGQVIGYVGCTGRCFGDHLHFETRINGAVVNPMNYL